ncbi:MAG TPA: YggS family pyridoxal phosphate enzyme, partial [Porticoccaceae bacterium]|nr:YggS family pyridoxal phosphate enzyme [Porticoccaceae bacterium]
LQATINRGLDNSQKLDTLSMGMSADLEAAILEGATILRVGTDIFGQRVSNNG